ncbi:LacI family DNA-binding transcriptional regulator [Actinokineospora bangkokensis]|uniref:LacI family transcriptional regulator n=1 Tax=Actinokineospora bangkokensis TaxID=1193682 RepID=A0A1Q9LBP3_9PSEU|nr:LacI family DNA-binding transcriptional regulator [Actinokineospora bangkokensis]OLR89449.1 LacI family transcriptional regulator [Actinokineospora bangkokensis]
MRVTIADVARRARVSKATVSRVLNNRGEVDAATAIRVREVIAATGYTPSAGAVGLATGRTRTIGILVPDLASPWTAAVLQGVADVLEEHGYGLLVSTTHRGPDALTRFARRVSGKSFDASLLVEPPDQPSYLAELHASGLPIAVVDDRREHPGFACVVADHRAGAGAAARHLLAAGRTRPLVLATGGTRCARERDAGFAEAFTAAGHRVTHRVLPAATRESGATTTADALAAGATFDSVFAHADLPALGALDALRAAGRRVPEDVAVVGFDDSDLATHADPPLTTVRRPARSVGEAAARMLLANLEGNPFPTDPVVVPTELVVRTSA